MAVSQSELQGQLAELVARHRVPGAVVAVWQAAPKNTTCTVNASNRSQFDCVLPPCLQTLAGSSFPTAAFSSPGPGYTNDSAIINVANGQPVVGPASRADGWAEEGAGAGG